MASLQNVLVVLEFLTAHNEVDFFGGPMFFGVSVVGSVARLSRGERSGAMMKKTNYLVARHHR